MSLTVFYRFYLSFTLFLVLWSCCMSLSFSYFSWFSLTVSINSMELLHDSHCVLRLLALYNCLSNPMELLHVSHCLLWLLADSHCLYQFQRVAPCLSLFLMVFGCWLSLSQSLWSHGVATFLSLSPMVPGFS